MTTDNWIDCRLDKREEEKVRRGGELCQSIYVKTLDTIFEIAEGIEILRGLRYGDGVQGSFAAALVQYGYTARDQISPIDKSIRTHFKYLRDNEQEVRSWWAAVAEAKRREWVGASSVYRHFKAFKEPRPPRPRRTVDVTPIRTRSGRPAGYSVDQIEQIARQALRPSDEVLKAREAAEAVREAEAMETASADQQALRRQYEAACAEQEDLQAENERLQNAVAEARRRVAELQESSRPRVSTEGDAYCSFCNKSQHEVEFLAASREVFICAECVDVCVGIFHDLRVKAAAAPTIGRSRAQSERARAGG